MMAQTLPSASPDGVGLHILHARMLPLLLLVRRTMPAGGGAAQVHAT